MEHDLFGADWHLGERFLQIIWNERYLIPELTTQDGRPLKIISPGTWNVSAGPDFKNATLLLDGTLHTGDVEIHRCASDWKSHGHDGDSLYDNVILHVVWKDNAPPPRPNLPTLVLENCLHPDWCRFLWQMEDSCYSYSQQLPPGDCAIRWSMTEDRKVRELLTTAGMARLSAKEGTLMRLSADRGEEQTLYESLFEALGYKNNRVPFRTLAQDAPLATVKKLPDTTWRTAVLLGKAGFIPDTTRSPVLPEWRHTVAQLWDCWWNSGASPTPNLNWDNGPSRPFNSPFRRLLAAVDILDTMQWSPLSWLKQIMDDHLDSPRTFLNAFHALAKHESPYRSLKDFGHEIRPAADLLGQPRLLDLLANVFIPFLLGIAERMDGRDGPRPRLLRDAYQLLPPSQENRLFKEAVARYISPPSRATVLVKSLCQQQGIIDIYRNFCIALDNNCQACPFSTKGEQERQDA